VEWKISQGVQPKGSMRESETEANTGSSPVAPGLGLWHPLRVQDIGHLPQ
jgi:hypothetical protein